MDRTDDFGTLDFCVLHIEMYKRAVKRQICLQRMIIYKNNIRKKKKKKKKEKRINTFGDVCWFFRSFRQL